MLYIYICMFLLNISMTNKSLSMKNIWKFFLIQFYSFMYLLSREIINNHMRTINEKEKKFNKSDFLIILFNEYLRTYKKLQIYNTYLVKKFMLPSFSLFLSLSLSHISRVCLESEKFSNSMCTRIRATNELT